METLEQHNKPKAGLGKGFIIAIIAAVLAVAGGVWLISLIPSTYEREQQMIEGAYREGSPEFEALTKRISIQTDRDRTTESPIGLGTIVMSIVGTIRNNSDQTLTGLEIKVGVVDTFGQTLKERIVIVVPKQKETLEPKQAIDVVVRIDGFKEEEDRAQVRWKVTAIKTD